MLTYDVVIVGGGVAGLFAGYNISKNGFRVALVEMKDEKNVGEKVCGDAIGEHHFIELGLDLPTIGFDAENIFNGVKVISPDEKYAISVIGKGYALNRKNFGLRLYRMAINSGVEGYLGYFFNKPIIEGSEIKGVVVKDKNGFEYALHSKVVIDASGTSAVVRRSLPREWWVSEAIPKEDYNITYREIVSGDIDLDHDYAYIYINNDIAPGGYWWLFPKKKGLYNIGLGVQWKDISYNPKKNYDLYIRSKLGNKIHEVIHAGGGIVPTRRPIPCMVWNGFIVIGDAAATANPLHGGGIGSAMISAKLASDTIKEAFEKGSVSREDLWIYHIRYHRAYGAKQAALDIARMFLQRMDNNDLNFIFKSKLVDGNDVYELGSKGSLASSILSRVQSILTLARRPVFISKLYRLKQYMDKAYELYLNYPPTPSDYIRWKLEEESLFKEYRKWLDESFR